MENAPLRGNHNKRKRSVGRKRPPATRGRDAGLSPSSRQGPVAAAPGRFWAGPGGLSLRRCNTALRFSTYGYMQNEPESSPVSAPVYPEIPLYVSGAQIMLQAHPGSIRRLGWARLTERLVAAACRRPTTPPLRNRVPHWPRPLICSGPAQLAVQNVRRPRSRLIAHAKNDAAA